MTGIGIYVIMIIAYAFALDWPRRAAWLRDTAVGKVFLSLYHICNGMIWVILNNVVTCASLVSVTSVTTLRRAVTQPFDRKKPCESAGIEFLLGSIGYPAY